MLYVILNDIVYCSPSHNKTCWRSRLMKKNLRILASSHVRPTERFIKTYNKTPSLHLTQSSHSIVFHNALCYSRGFLLLLHKEPFYILLRIWLSHQVKQQNFSFVTQLYGWKYTHETFYKQNKKKRERKLLIHRNLISQNFAFCILHTILILQKKITCICILCL